MRLLIWKSQLDSGHNLCSGSSSVLVESRHQNFYAVSRVHLDPPPSHLLKRIIKPTRESSVVAAIHWRIKNESAACEMYVKQAMEAHVNFSYEPAGLCVNNCSPHLEASPHDHISCNCCGEGLIEIKRMYKYRHVDPCTIDDPSFYLKRSETGHLQLDHKHEYYYQVPRSTGLVWKGIQWLNMLISRRIICGAYTCSCWPVLFVQAPNQTRCVFVKVVLPQLLTSCTTLDNEKVKKKFNHHPATVLTHPTVGVIREKEDGW